MLHPHQVRCYKIRTLWISQRFRPVSEAFVQKEQELFLSSLAPT
jgi:hypothetical protein